MASVNKQQKRAHRAKSKAKQNRVKRQVAALELDPNDDRIDLESVDLSDMFIAMREAGKDSQQALCLAFLSHPLLEIVLEQEGEDGATDFILSALIGYHQWVNDGDEAAGLAWIESEAFQTDYIAASAQLSDRS
ncbi:hypothetical protein WG219_06890 [Ectopseudomonas mendocina]|uniref:Uncharacterized protein n=1 Tax=Ectopseudomonas mendocina TaxID=300 RepID=A0ABZ2RR82_ECTME